MSYKLREDVVLEHVCGANILVALRSAWDEYPFAMQISDSSALLWEMISSGTDREEIESHLIEKLGISTDKARSYYDRFIRYCEKNNYFIRTEEKE